MATTYRKTPKGITEIETRQHRLVPRLRSTLILVDGKRTDDELRPLLPQADESLLALVAQGFIEVVSVTDTRSVPPRPAAGPAGATAPASSAAAPATPGPAAPPGPDFPTLRREAVRLLNDQVGPMAESLAIRMERAKTLDELQPLLQTAWQMIGNVRGVQAAAAFRARFIGR